MSADLIFSVCNMAVIPGWLLLILLPKWKWTLGLITTGIIPFVLALVYAGLFVSRLGSMPEAGGFASLPALMILFSDPYLLTVGWIHYLAFDLFVGSWELHDSQKLGISHWLVIPCLLFTFMLGPIGLGLYLLLRYLTKGKLMVLEPV
ncbi:MAG: ABA4-like family protein [Pseudohongiellaceae bacterium]